MLKRKLPIGIQNLSEIINEGYYYVDKTPFIAQLANQGKYYFLSRPRRFGKSLLLDTIKELFEGNRSLFKGLFIDDKWNWEKKYPVIRISFGSGTSKSREELDEKINELLRDNANQFNITLTNTTISGQFRELIEKTQQAFTTQVILLIDEYDKPILDNITNTNIATEMREGLKNIYSVIKDADAFLKFCILTGVSKFSKVSLFSGLNNLNDISMDAEYSAICGYRDEDIDYTFAPELPGLDRDDIRRWYNGYNWCGDSVYNPFDALLLFQKREFKPYWFETATPTFLIELLRNREVFTPDLSKVQSDSELLSQFDVDYIGTEALLFQAGYLTIERVEHRIDKKILYWLTYPNLEVRCSLNDALLKTLGVARPVSLKSSSVILACLEKNDLDAVHAQLKSLYASIPHDWYRNNKIANYEGHYASIFYSHFAALGLHVVVEDSSKNGKVDMMIDFNNTIFIFEFKVVEDQATGAALKQIKQKHYAEKYQTKQCPIYLIGVEFSKKQQQIIGFEFELYSSMNMSNTN
jgi:Predicted AAA-ATPase/PD-(D/E)XK nuclease superfamily